MIFLRILSYLCLVPASIICYIFLVGIQGFSQAEVTASVAGWGIILAVLVVIYSNIVLHRIRKIRQKRGK